MKYRAVTITSSGLTDPIVFGSAISMGVVAGSSSSSASGSSSGGRAQEMRDMIATTQAARDGYAEATKELGQLQDRYDAVRAALQAAEEETAAARADAADAQAREYGTLVFRSHRFVFGRCR